MNKAIYIGELALNVSLCADGHAETGVGDWAVNAAVIDGRMELPTIWVGEAAAGTVGDHILKYLEDANVGTESVDRFTEGVSPVRVFAGGDPSTTVDHSNYPEEPVNAVWPRVEEGDIVIYGSYMTLEERDHARVLDLLKHAKARKAYLVYLPYFEAHQVPRITRVMPSVFDCLELADLVVGRDADIRAIFPETDMEAIFKDHILFYCRRFLHLDPKSKVMRFFDGDKSWTLECHPTTNTEFQWSAGALAGIVRALTEGRRDADDIMAYGNETAHSELATSISHPCTR
ncbi:hypothetical protein [uncultured Duncaniella sp.]|uniref:hypothetical protein n=1 Tax=uncultured Duncaniella sp. TaxID=2768039 RepID=UPI0025EC32C3|nr:hypothetical protein [uncultured Duncaniella sp.]